nr:hypothetical protein [Tanacetum cinerariifolium]
MSLDDIYKNFKIIEQEVRGTTSTNISSQNMDSVSSPSPNSTNEVPADFEVSTASPQVSTANLSDATVYAFLANQPNGSQLVHEDLEQIHEDDLKEMDLKWQLAQLSMRAKRFFQKTRKKITINGSDIAGYDKSKVECFNCHKMGHFARECRVPKNQENKTRNQETTRRTVNVEDTSSKAMALEKISNEKDALETKIKKFENSSQSLDKLIGSQVTDNSKKGLGYKSSVKISASVKENNGAPLIEDWESDEKDEVESPPEKERKTIAPSVDKIEVVIPKQNDKPARKPVEYAEMCKYHQRGMMVNGTTHSRVTHTANTIPKAMLTRTGLKHVNSVRPVNPKRNFQRRASYNNRNFFKTVNTTTEKVNTVRPNSAVLNAVRANKGKDVKASACWV